MSDETTAVITEVKAVVAGDDLPIVDVESIKQANDNLKKEISGLNRKNNELIETNNNYNTRLANLEAEKLSDDERKELELKNRENTILNNEAKLLRQANHLELVKIANEQKADLSLLDFIDMSDKEKAIEQLNALQQNVTKLANETATKNMSVGTPPANNEQSSVGVVNPFAKDTKNYTEQARLQKENPALYDRLKLQAG